MEKLKAIALSIVIALSISSLASCSDSTDNGSGSLDNIQATTSEIYSTGGEIQHETVEITSTSTEVSEATTDSQNYNANNINNYITVEKAYPPIWKVTDTKTGNSMFMLGTMHVAVKSTFPLPDEVYDIYNDCSGVAVEYDVRDLQKNLSTSIDVVSELLYTDGSTIKNHISREAYDIGRAVLEEYGMWIDTMDYFVPSYWLDIIQSAGVTNIDGIEENGIDLTFIDKAYEDNKPVVSIEGLETQINILNGYSDEMVEFILVNDMESLQVNEDTVKQMADLYNAWAEGDLKRIEELAMYDESNIEFENDDEVPEELIKEAEQYSKMILDDRNVVMVKRAEEFITNNNNYFFMVGALHYIGDNGIISLLESDGYKVERLEYKR